MTELKWAKLRLPSPSPSLQASSGSFPLSWWCSPTTSSSVIPFFFCLQSLSTSGAFPVSWLFASGSQIIATSVSASAPPVNIQDWFPLDLTDWMQSEGVWRVFSNTIVQKHQFFSAQLTFWSKANIYTWLLKSHTFDFTSLCWQSNVSAFSYAV